MQIKVVTCVRNTGVGRATGRKFDFLVVGGVMQTARGHELVEFMLDGADTPPEPGKLYEVEVSFYPNREKKLAFRVEGLRLVAGAAAAVAKAA